ncbi:MAG: hypothetical protein AABZ55_12390, partial [Bdellovibrionota bacterium]
MKTKNRVISGLLLMSATLTIAHPASASSLKCSRYIDAETRQIIVMSEALFLACQSPIAVDLNNNDNRNEYCAGATFLVNSSEKADLNDGSQSGNLTGQVVFSVLNQVAPGLVVEIQYTTQKSGETTARIKASENNIATKPSIAL